MAPEVLSRVFDLFFQEDRSPTAVGEVWVLA